MSDWRSNFFSVFVGNLSWNVRVSDLWEVFEEFGTVVDVYFPKRRFSRNMHKSTYAFVRFRYEAEMHRSVVRGDGISMDGRRIRVSKAVKNKSLVRSDERNRSSDSWKFRQFEPVKFNDESQVDRIDAPKLPAESRKKRINQTEVGDHGQAKKKSGILLYPQIPKEDMEWIEKSLVGTLSSYIHHHYFQDNCSSSGISCQVRPLGGCSVLLTFEDKDVMDFYLKEHASWFSTWFVSIKPCDGSICSGERMVWLNLESVPLQLWHDSFFMEVGKLWGTFVTVDDSTYRKCRFDVARILVSTKRSVKIPGKIVVSHNGAKFEIVLSIEAARDFISLISDRKFPGAGNTRCEGGESSSSDIPSISLDYVEEEPRMGNIAADSYEKIDMENSNCSRTEDYCGSLSCEREAFNSQQNSLSVFELDGSPLVKAYGGQGEDENVNHGGDRQVNGLSLEINSQSKEAVDLSLAVWAGPPCSDGLLLNGTDESNNVNAIDVPSIEEEATSKDVVEEFPNGESSVLNRKFRAMEEIEEEIEEDWFSNLLEKNRIRNKKADKKRLQKSKAKNTKQKSENAANESLSDGDFHNRNHVLMKEAEETLKMGKMLGISFDCDESLIMEKFKSMIEEENAT